MVDDGEAPHAAGFGAVLRAVDGLRDDVREDIGHLRDDVREDNHQLEARVMAAVARVEQAQRESVEAHAKLHLEAAIENETELGRIRDFMRNAEIAAARRDGALGVFRFALEQLSRHWQPLVGVLAALAAVVGVVGGSIRLDIAIR